jgi:hypothetical protein
MQQTTTGAECNPLFPVVGSEMTRQKSAYVKGLRRGDFFVAYKRKNTTRPLTTRPLTTRTGGADWWAYGFIHAQKNRHWKIQYLFGISYISGLGISVTQTVCWLVFYGYSKVAIP